MKLLLDTCTFLWLVAEPQKLGERARVVLDDPVHEIVLSDVSILEVCLKWQTGKLRLPDPPRRWVEENSTAWSLKRVGLATEHAYRATELPDHHRDPFDRLLVAQAIVEGMTLVTPDPAVTGYPVATLW